ncbi:MAG TPA: hypothetical protein VHK25_06560 [Acidimicrobiales bacterium]|nr:hypothetical protein [Acidimicrobiales bacterium]
MQFHEDPDPTERFRIEAHVGRTAAGRGQRLGHRHPVAVAVAEVQEDLPEAEEAFNTVGEFVEDEC